MPPAEEKRINAEIRKNNRTRRDEKIAADFKELYQVNRLRIDDCLAQLAEKYFLSAKTIERIIQAQK